MHTCIPTHPRTCIHDTHTHYTHTCMHTYNTCTNTYLDTFIHALVRLCVCVCVCVYALVRTCVRVYPVRTVTIAKSAEAWQKHSRPCPSSWHVVTMVFKDGHAWRKWYPTSCSVEDETRNTELDGNRNPEWWGDFIQLQIQIKQKSQFEFVPQDTSEFKSYQNLNSTLYSEIPKSLILLILASWLKSPHNSGFWLQFNSAFRVSSSIDRAVPILAAEKTGKLKNWRIWYKTGQMEVLSVHDLLPHPATAGEITQ